MGWKASIVLAFREPIHLPPDAGPPDRDRSERLAVALGAGVPTGQTGGWLVNFLNLPAVNSIYADAQHPSALVLGHLEGGRAHATPAKCDTVLNQPCRTNQASLPAGTITLP